MASSVAALRAVAVRRHGPVVAPHAPGVLTGGNQPLTVGAG